MARTAVSFQCTTCGARFPRWAGRCGQCEEWNTLESAGPPAARPERPSGGPAPTAAPIGSLGAEPEPAVPTRLGELDRVLGGGLVPGSVTLLGGEPGIGKSTALLQMLAAVARGGRRALLVSAEESPAQVRGRAERLGAVCDELWLACHTDLDDILAVIADVEPAVAVVDSIQTVADASLPGVAGSVTQVRNAAQRLQALARSDGRALVLVGHVTKDGAIAGPRTLEHLVDTVLSFEGDRHHALRLLRSVKHRFGATDDLGLLEMTEAGLVTVGDPSAVLLGDRRPGVPGSVVHAAVEGRRPLLVEVQALVAPSPGGAPRRSGTGVDHHRLGVLLAVLETRAGLRLPSQDVWVSVVGGVRVAEPGADLAVALAVASAARNRAIPPHLVVCGEVGLGGELRQPAQLARRLSEAARLGFHHALVPASAPDPPPGVEALRAATLGEALRFAGVADR